MKDHKMCGTDNTSLANKAGDVRIVFGLLPRVRFCLAQRETLRSLPFLYH